MLPDPPSPAPTTVIARMSAGLRAYVDKVRLFRRNARLYLVFTVVTGAALGVYRLLFNFYVLSLGYDEAVIGRLIAAGSVVGLIGALPVGLLGDRVGRRASLALSSIVASAAIGGMIVWRDTTGLLAMSALMGLSQALASVILGPFLMENSDEVERTHLFSFSFGFQMIAGFGGSWLGGRLPTWFGALVGVSPTSTRAYAMSLAVVVGVSLLALVPVLLMRRPLREDLGPRQAMSPLAFARANPGLLSRLMLPMLVTSLGAGLLMPFMNVFFRNAHGATDSTVGTLFAIGSLAMAAGLLSAPPLAERYGKARTVVLTQALSIPFLLILGFSPWFALASVAYLVRLGLMNMSNPVYQNFVMEQVDEGSRATVASLVSMCWSFGWALSPVVSGAIQIAYGFDPLFLMTMLSYAVAIGMIWVFFDRAADANLGVIDRVHGNGLGR